MGWTVYLSVYKNPDSSIEEKELKEKVTSVCEKQLRIPGSEPLYDLGSESFKNNLESPFPDFELIQVFCSKVQSSWNPFLSIVLTMITGKELRGKFSKDLKVSIFDDFGSMWDIDKVSFFLLLFLSFVALLLTPIWLVFSLLLKLAIRRRF